MMLPFYPYLAKQLGRDLNKQPATKEERAKHFPTWDKLQEENNLKKSRTQKTANTHKQKRRIRQKYLRENGHAVAWANKQEEERYWGENGVVWQDWRISQGEAVKNVFLEIKQRLNIIEVAKNLYGQTVKERGHYGLVSCPNPHHEDKNPSCALWSNINAFKCYSCGESGDIIRFAELMEASQ